jgi:hypothetical protein
MGIPRFVCESVMRREMSASEYITHSAPWNSWKPF